MLNYSFKLIGYKNLFNHFVDLESNNKLPSKILLSRQEGIRKSTFVYHFINYLFSKNDQYQYSVNDFLINVENSNFKQVNSGAHPNLFLIENSPDETEIKIDKIRSLLKFLSKTTYKQDLKIVLIDNAEFLNINSSNALLKAIEEPLQNTYFFIVHDSASKISKTLKSRCVEFKLFFDYNNKKDIFKNIINLYSTDNKLDQFIPNLLFDSPGNIAKFYLMLKNENFDPDADRLSCIFFLIEKYNDEKNQEILDFITLNINLFYNELLLSDNRNLINHFFNQTEILRKIDQMKKFNINNKNVLFWIKDILLHERK